MTSVPASLAELQQELLRVRLLNSELLIALQVLEITVRTDPRQLPVLPDYYRYSVAQAQAAIAKFEKEN